MCMQRSEGSTLWRLHDTCVFVKMIALGMFDLHVTCESWNPVWASWFDPCGGDCHHIERYEDVLKEYFMKHPARIATGLCTTWDVFNDICVRVACMRVVIMFLVRERHGKEQFCSWGEYPLILTMRYTLSWCFSLYLAVIQGRSSVSSVLSWNEYVQWASVAHIYLWRYAWLSVHGSTWVILLEHVYEVHECLRSWNVIVYLTWIYSVWWSSQLIDHGSTWMNLTDLRNLKEHIMDEMYVEICIAMNVNLIWMLRWGVKPECDCWVHEKDKIFDYADVEWICMSLNACLCWDSKHVDSVKLCMWFSKCEHWV